ncbi:glycosyltransferase [bacterium]|nr:glycosyltransferase [bacterium]
MSAPLDSNLRALRDKGLTTLADTAVTEPAGDRFEVTESRSGAPSLRVNGRALHSTYDPVREAKQQLARLSSDLPQKSTLVLIGLGLGFLAEAWLDARPDDELFVLEPDEDLFRHAIRSRDLHEVISGSSLHVGSSGLEVLADTFQQRGLTNGHTPVFVEWPGAREYAPGTAENLRKMLSTVTVRMTDSPLRILVAGPVYGGTLPMGPYVTDAFRKLGHHAELLDYSSFDEGRRLLDSLTGDKQQHAQLMSEFTQLLGRGIVARAKDMRAQIVFFLAQAPGTKEALQALRDEGIVSAMWFVEDSELATWWPQVAPEYDVFFHIQGDKFSDQLLQAGAKHAHYLPVAADPRIHRPLDLTAEDRTRFDADVSHVGAGYFNRRRFFLHLLDRDFKLWGNDWDEAPGLAKVLQDNGRRVSTEETVRIFNASRINLNLHSSTYAQGVNPHGDFVNPRTFEIASCGAFQLVDHRSLLAEMFEPCKEIAVFHNLDECRAQIDHFLAHPDEAKAIAEAGRERVLHDHTYAHRMDEAVRVIRANAPLQEAKQTGNTVAELVTAASGDAELESFLRTMGEDHDELSIDAIAERIRKGEGDLSRPEALFLLLHEFQLKAEEKGLA